LRGDARLSQLPAGENRLVSYAVDEKTKMAQERQNTRAISKARSRGETAFKSPMTWEAS
jgi:hypothetical protein